MSKKNAFKSQNKQDIHIISSIKSVDVENRTIEMIGSTQDPDRVGDIMIMAGCDYSYYLKNPVILANHDYWSPAIAKALSVTVEGDKLIFKIQFAETETGDEWFYLYSKGFMNASSIGFIPLEYTPNDKGGFTFTKWQLLELSLVTVPANPNAVQRAYEEGHISKSLFESLSKQEKTLKGGDDVKLEEVQKLIDEAVKAKAVEIRAEVEKEFLLKAGAKLSAASKEKLNKVADDMGKCHQTMQDTQKALKACHEQMKEFLGGTDDSDGDEGGEDGDPEEKDYSVEEIGAMVIASIGKIMTQA